MPRRCPEPVLSQLWRQVGCAPNWPGQGAAGLGGQGLARLASPLLRKGLRARWVELGVLKVAIVRWGGTPQGPGTWFRLQGDSAVLFTGLTCPVIHL